MSEKPLAGKKVAVLVETEYIHDEIEYYKKRVPELGGELHLLSYLWGQPSKDFVNDIDNPNNPVTSVYRLTVDRCVTRSDPADYAIVICAANYVAVRLREIPPMGSLGSPELTRTAPAVRFFAQAMENRNIVKGAMCHALWLLTPHPELLRGRRVICHTVVLSDIHNAGAIFVPEPSHVVVDGDLVTARSFHDVEPYFDTLVRTAMNRDRGAATEKVLVIASNYGFWGEELQAPWDALRVAGYAVTLGTPTGKKPLPFAISVDPDFVDPIQKYHVNPPEVCHRVKELIGSGDWDSPVALTDASMAGYDALVLAGGPGADLDLTNNPAVHRLVLEALGQGKVVAAMCFSVAALAYTRDPARNYRSVVWGKTVTAHPRSWDFLADLDYKLFGAVDGNAGTDLVTPGFLLPVQAVMTDAVGPEGCCLSDPSTSREKPSVVYDDPFITACSVESSIAYGRKIVEVLGGRRSNQGSGAFPKATVQELGGLRQRVFTRGGTQVILTPVGVGGVIPLHHHTAAQIGLCAQGYYLMQCGDRREVVAPLLGACDVRPGVTHGAPDPTVTAYVSLDIKREGYSPGPQDGTGGFLAPDPEAPLGDRCSGATVQGPWFRVFFLRLPPGGSVTFGGEDGDVVGIPVSGRYVVTIGGEEQSCDQDQAHFALGGTRCRIDNRFGEVAHAVVVIIHDGPG